MRTVINSIQILNENISKTINESNDSLIKSNEDKFKTVQEIMESIIEKIDKIEKNLNDIKDKVTTDTTNYLDEAQKKIMKICEETLNTMKNVWDEFKIIQQNTKQNSEDILSVKQSHDNVQNKLNEMNQYKRIMKI